MFRSALACLMFALGGASAAEVAPAPRPATALPSLVLVEEVPGAGGTVDTRRVLRVGIGRDGKLLPSETVWEGDQQFLGHFGGHQLAADHYIVTKPGSIIDLRAKKVIHQGRGEFRAIEGTKVFYHVNNRREEAVYSFDLATGDSTREPAFVARKYMLSGVVSPDRSAAVESGPVADELFLHLPGATPKSLGKGFHIDIGPLASTFGPAPVAWLNNGVFVTQRGNGKLVTVDVSAKVTDLLTIKDAPKEVVGAPYFFRDGSGRLVYVCGRAAFSLDPDKKTFAKYEWRDLGHGFEASWTTTPKVGHTIRLNGKEIGAFNCAPHTAKTAPGLMAVEARVKGDDFGPPDWVAVWTDRSGEWQSLKLWPNCVVGWVK